MSGADIVGVNCKFDPTTSIKTLILMKEALDKEGLSPHLMIQPVGYHTPDAGRAGFASLPELPFGKKFISKSWLCVYLILRHVIIGYLLKTACSDLLVRFLLRILIGRFFSTLMDT